MRPFYHHYGRHRSGFRVAGWRLDAVLPGDAIGKAFHRRRWWTNSRVTADHAAEQRRSSGARAFR